MLARLAWAVRLIPQAAVLLGRLVPAAAAVTLLASSAQSQDDESAGAREARAKLASIQWVEGPADGRLGKVAGLRVPEGCRFAESAGAKSFLEATQNIPSGDEVGLLLCRDRQNADNHWFVVYSYDASGYVRDDDKQKLDADAILATLRRGTEEANRERRERGWEEMSLDGWVRPPYYDERTNNLTWSFTGRTSGGDTSINHSVRLLGRGGVLHADLVMDPSQIESVVTDFDSVVAATAFVSGSRYAEWREGDKVASYGLTALVAGGAGAVAVKSGLFAKLGKLLAAMWKLVVAAVVGIGAMVKSIFSRKAKAEPAASGGRTGSG